MPARLHVEAARVRARVERGDPFWPSQLTVAVTIALNLVLTEKVTVGPTWLLPGALLAALVIVVPRRAAEHSTARRRLALAVCSTRRWRTRGSHPLVGDPDSATTSTPR